MKFRNLFILFLVSILFCSYDPPREPETIYSPILMTREVLESSVKFSTPRAMKVPGKIYLKDQFLYIVEKFEGIHVVNNSNREDPQKIGFIQIPGCIDLAIKGNSLFADNAVDLITIDLGNSDMQSAKITSRTKNAFPEVSPPDVDGVPWKYSKSNRPEGTIIVGWKKSEF